MHALLLDRIIVAVRGTPAASRELTYAERLSLHTRAGNIDRWEMVKSRPVGPYRKAGWTLLLLHKYVRTCHHHVGRAVLLMFQNAPTFSLGHV